MRKSGIYFMYFHVTNSFTVPFLSLIAIVPLHLFHKLVAVSFPVSTVSYCAAMVVASGSPAGGI